MLTINEVDKTIFPTFYIVALAVVHCIGVHLRWLVKHIDQVHIKHVPSQHRESTNSLMNFTLCIHVGIHITIS